MQTVVGYIEAWRTDSICSSLLIDMTNEYIDIRNQMFDSLVNPISDEIEEEEDFHYISEMDRKINKVVEYLEG